MPGLDSPGLSAPRVRPCLGGPAAVEPLEPRLLLAFTFYGQEVATGLNQPAAVAVADFDNNGTLDVAVANASGNDVTVLLGNGMGGFTAMPSRSAVGSAPRAVAAGDLDGDGLVDLVVANSLLNTVTVLRNLGGGQFAPGHEIVVGSRPRAVVVGDLSGDGRADLAVALFNTDQVAVLLNTGGEPGVISLGAPTAYAVGDGPVSVAMADLDGDGDLDLAVANITSSNVTVLRNDGAGGFTSAGSHAVGAVPRSIAAGDVDMDGAVDLVIANSFGGTVSVLRNLGTGSFEAHREFLAGNQPHAVVAHDFDGDGDQDIATANLMSGDVTLLANDAGRGLELPVSVPAGAGAIALAAADVNGDRDLDLFVVNSLDNSLTLLHSGAMPGNTPPMIGSLAAAPAPILSGAEFTLTALGVFDPDGVVAEVRFFRDSNFDGLLDPDDEALFPTDTDGSDGWSRTGVALPEWNTGINRFFAQAFDEWGVPGNLAAVEVALLRPPGVEGLIVSPSPVEPGQVITLTATGVSDEDGSVQSVRFYRDANGNGVLDAGDQELSPADGDGSNGYTWTGLASPSWGPGTVRFFARAVDDDGLLGGVAAAVVTQTHRPTIEAGSASPDPLIFGDPVTLTASGVMDLDGWVRRVEFFGDADGSGAYEPENDVLIGEDTDGNDGFSITALYPQETGLTGTIRFFARAVDNLGVAGPMVTFTTSLRYRPEVGMLVPDRYEAEPGESVTLTALASDFDGAVTSVAFYADSNGNGVLDGEDELISTDATGGDGFTTTIHLDPGVAVGRYRYFARATDDHGLVSNVADVVVLVNRRPMMDGFSASPNPVRYFETLVLSAFATDVDGEVETVLFYRDADGDGRVSVGDEFLGEGAPDPTLGFVLEAAVSPSWGPGQSLLLALARDDLGSLSEPAFASVTVIPLPVVGALTVSPTIAPAGTTLTLTATGVVYEAGTVGSVTFYRDRNGDGRLDGGDELLGVDTGAAGGWTTTATVAQDWARGPTVFFAVAADPDGLEGGPATATAIIGSVPVIGSFVAGPDPVAYGGTLTLTASGVSSADGVISAVLFFRDADGDGVLSEEERASPIAGTAVGGGTWRAQVAAPAGWPVGPTRLFALAVDDIGLESEVRSAVVTVGGAASVLTLAPLEETLLPGRTMTLAATVDPSGIPAAAVRFYRDADGNGVLSALDEVLPGGVEVGAGEFRWAGIVPEAWGVGRQVFFAVPVTVGGEEGAAASVEASIWSLLFIPEGWRNDVTINEYLPVVNPHPFPVRYRVIARYEVGERDQVIFDGEIAAQSRGGLIITERGRGHEALTRLNVGYALEVQSSAPLGAMLSRYDNFSPWQVSMLDAANGEALTNVTSRIWTFAEVFKSSGFIYDFLTYYNPTEFDGEVTFDLYYEGGGRHSFTYIVPALRRGGVNFNADPIIPFGRFGVVVTSTVPLVVAQSRYESSTGQGFTILGEPSMGQTSVLVPFVETRPGLFNVVSIFNPSPSELTTVSVAVVFESDGGEAPPPQALNVIAPPGEPLLFSLEQYSIDAGARASLRIESDLPIVVRFAMADHQRGDATAGGPVQPHTGWLFADAFLDFSTAGSVGFEYLTVTNPGDGALDVTVVFYSSTGEPPVEVEIELAGRQTRTIELHREGGAPLREGLNFFGLGVFAEAPIVASFVHWDLFQNGGWATFGTPMPASGPLT